MKFIDFLDTISARSFGVPAYTPQALAKFQDPLDIDCENFYLAIEEEFPFTMSGSSLSEEEIETACGLFQWPVKQLIETTTNATNVELIKILHFAKVMDKNSGKLWMGLKSSGVLRDDRLQELNIFIADSKIRITDTHPNAAYIQDAFDKKDWKRIVKQYPRIQGHLVTAPLFGLLSQAARALSIYSPEDMGNALTETYDIAKQMTLIKSASPHLNALEIAITSQNWVLKLCSFDLHLSHHNSIEGAERLWEILLSQTTQTNSEHPNWLTVFNGYSELQPLIGKVLCKMPNAVIDEYFSFIDMCPTNEDSTSRMFESVQLHGNQLQKRLVWERAFTRWTNWNFNLSNFKNLISIKKSSLDIAVQPYYQECLSEDQRNEYESNLRADFNKKANEWHENVMGYRTEINRILSAYQPLGHSQKSLGAYEGYEQGGHLYPNWIPRHLYWKIGISLTNNS